MTKSTKKLPLKSFIEVHTRADPRGWWYELKPRDGGMALEISDHRFATAEAAREAGQQALSRLYARK
jgi:hypothetical protein